MVEPVSVPNISTAFSRRCEQMLLTGIDYMLRCSCLLLQTASVRTTVHHCYPTGLVEPRLSTTLAEVSGNAVSNLNPCYQVFGLVYCSRKCNSHICLRQKLDIMYYQDSLSVFCYIKTKIIVRAYIP